MELEFKAHTIYKTVLLLHVHVLIALIFILKENCFDELFILWQMFINYKYQLMNMKYETMQTICCQNYRNYIDEKRYILYVNIMWY